jgi:uncharacterized protein YfkK (UPF0435 family)
MSATPQNPDDQELDLSQISRKIGHFFEGISNRIFKWILFFKRNIVWVGTLFVIGAGLGFYFDKNTKIYDNQIIVSPNFGSTDDMYAKIELINAKIGESDTIYLKNVVGIKEPKKLRGIEVSPMTDVYKFVENKAQNFELIKLMAEDGDMETLIKDQTTSKNYDFHIINFVTKSVLERKEILEPLLAFLDNSDYYNKAKEVYIENSNTKIEANKNMIGQIDGLLSTFAENKLGGAKSDKSVYINENSQINDLIKSKNQFVNEIGYIKKELQTHDKVIKEGSSIINVHNTRTLDTKMRVLLPVIFLFTYFLFISLFNFYKKQSSLYKDGNI